MRAAPVISAYAMNKKGLETLRRLIDELGAGCLTHVVSARDPNVDQDYYDHIRELCRRAGVAHFDRTESLSHATQYALVVGWRWLIEDPDVQLVVFHDSLLPRYRGFNPLVSCLLKSEPELGVTASWGAREYDAGDIIAQRSIAVNYPMKIAQAIDLIAPLYAELAIEIVRTLQSGRPLPSRPQDHAQATYSLWRDEDDYRIDWRKSAGQIQRFIDAVGHPYKGGSALVRERKVRILDSCVHPDAVVEIRDVGKVLFVRDDLPTVVCGEGLLTLRDVRDDETGEQLLPLRSFRTRFT